LKNLGHTVNLGSEAYCFETILFYSATDVLIVNLWDLNTLLTLIPVETTSGKLLKFSEIDAIH